MKWLKCKAISLVVLWRSPCYVFFVIVSFLICGVANRKGDDSLTA